jgi:hypothetical protein
MKKRLAVTLILCLGWALAQTADDVLTELKKTDVAIERARPVVRESNNDEARRILDNAVQIQVQAWENYDGRRFKRAYELTNVARRRARQAALMVAVDPERIREEIGRTSEIMNELGPIISRANEPKALELWRMAQGEQASAKDQFNNKRYRLALKFTLAARLHTKTAFDVVRRLADPEKVQAELDRTGELIVRAREPVRASGNQRAQQLLEKAGTWQDQALAALRDRRLGQALKLTLAARDLAIRAWELARGTANPVLVEQALNETDRLIENWTQAITESDNEEARGLLAQAQEHQKKAQEGFALRKLKPAFTETSIARRLLQRAIDLIQSEETPGQDKEQE